MHQPSATGGPPPGNTHHLVLSCGFGCCAALAFEAAQSKALMVLVAGSQSSLVWPGDSEV